MARARAVPATEVVQQDLASGELKLIYALFGQESYLARQAYDRLFAAAVAGGPRGFNEQIFDGDSATGDAITGAAQHLPMMASRRVIVVRNAAKLNAESQTRLAAYCANPSPTTVLLLLGKDGEKKLFDGRGKLAKSIKKNGRWCDFRKLYGRNLRSWIEAEARAMDKRLDHDAVGFLEAIMGNDLAQIANGLKLAALYVGDEDTIRRESLEEVVSGRKQEALWDMLDALGKRHLQPVLRNLQLLYGQGEGAYGVLSLAKRRLSMLLAAERGLARGLPRKDAMLAAGIPPNMAWKYDDQMGRYRPAELQRGLSRLLRAESDLKGGLRIDARWAVERALTDVIAG